jgi:hypothetical protein
MTLEALWDIEQIKQLKARYFRLVDTKDWESFVELFTEDCTHQMTNVSGEVTVDNERYFSDLREKLGTGLTIHHGHTPEITLTGPREAEGIWAMFDYVEIPSPTGSCVCVQHYGHYFETYRKDDAGTWRISSKRNVVLRIDDLSAP